MSFDAGSIVGAIELKTDEFKTKAREAADVAAEHSARINEGFAHIAESLSEVVGPALSQFSQRLGAAMQGFDNGGLVLGGIGALTISMGVLKEATENTAERFDRVGIEATKLGVPVEYLSRLSAAAKTVDIDVSQLGQTFVLMNQRIGEVAQGTDKQAVEAFGRLGISLDDLRQHADDTKWVIDTVIDRMDRLGAAGDKAAVLKDILGRGSAPLIPLFEKGPDEINRIADIVQKFGGVVSANDAQMAESFRKLEVYAGAAADGIEAAFSRPLLKYLDTHLDDIIAKMLKVQGTALNLGKDAPYAVDWLSDTWEGLKKGWNAITSIPGVTAAAKLAMAPSNMLTDFLIANPAGEREADKLHIDPADIKWRRSGPGGVPGVYLSPGDYGPIHHPDQSKQLGTEWPAVDLSNPPAAPYTPHAGEYNYPSQQTADLAWQAYHGRMSYLEDFAFRHGDKGAMNNLVSQEFKARDDQDEDLKHDVFTDGPPKVSFGGEDFKKAIWQGFKDAMDSHSATHQQEPVDNVLRSVLSQNTTPGGGAGGPAPTTQPSAGAAGQALKIDVTVNSTFDAAAITREISRQMTPAIQRAMDKLKSGITGEARRRNVNASMGGGSF